ncbi:hypothetical protein [Ekhidna sp.]|jgi:hypothetical protein|uniref:hypothetical protein n=1 Tax=Ekhidna sp. TaxID=2608089 RepID=UPI0032EAB8E3
MMGGGSGMMDFMVKSYKNNRGLLKNGKKSLKKIYQENNYFYVKKKIVEKTKDFDPEKKRLFLDRFHAKQKKVRTRQTFLFIIIFTLFGLLFYLLY